MARKFNEVWRKKIRPDGILSVVNTGSKKTPKKFCSFSAAGADNKIITPAIKILEAVFFKALKIQHFPVSQPVEILLFNCRSNKIPFWECYTLSMEEAAAYFRVGINKLRRLISEDANADFILWNGNRAQIKKKFEEYIDRCNEI